MWMKTLSESAADGFWPKNMKRVRKRLPIDRWRLSLTGATRRAVALFVGLVRDGSIYSRSSWDIDPFWWNSEMGAVERVLVAPLSAEVRRPPTVARSVNEIEEPLTWTAMNKRSCPTGHLFPTAAVPDFLIFSSKVIQLTFDLFFREFVFYQRCQIRLLQVEDF